MSRSALTLEFLGHVRAGRPVALATRIDGGAGVGAGLLVGPGRILGGTLGDRETDRRTAAFADRCISAGRPDILPLPAGRIFVDVQLPAPRLVIVGAVHIAVTLERLARELGFCTIVCDARDRFATEERFPEVGELIVGWPSEVLSRLELDEFSYVVVVTHDAKLDNPALEAALRCRVPYVGALGSKKTHARRVRALREAGVSQDNIARIHSPIGLGIGARSPAEIALATLAEIVSVRNRLEATRTS